MRPEQEPVGRPNALGRQPKKAGPRTKRAGARRRSLRERVTAWWRAALPAPVERAGSPPSAERRSKITAVAGPTVDELPAPTAASRSATQTRVAELVWGKGYLAPGGAQRVVDLVKPLGLSPAVTLLELGAGPGGSSQAIAARFGSYVSAFAADSHHAEMAVQFAVAHDLDKKISVRSLDTAGLNLKPNYFQGAFIHDHIHLLQDKGKLLQEVARSIKPRGRVVISDLFSAADALGPAAKAWTGNHVSPVHLCTGERLKADLKACGLDTSICEDESDAYLELALDAWGEFLRTPDAASLPAALHKPMLQGAECWNRLLAAIRSGDVRCLRIEAIKVRG